MENELMYNSAQQSKTVSSKRLYKDEKVVSLRINIILIVISLTILLIILVLSNRYFNRAAEKYTKDQVVETMAKVSVSMSYEFSTRISSWYDDLSVLSQFVSLSEFGQTEEQYITDTYTCLDKMQFEMFDGIGVLTNDGKLIMSDHNNYDMSTDTAIGNFLSKKPIHICFVTNTEGLTDKLIFAIPYDGEGDKSFISGIVGIKNKNEIELLLATDAFGTNYAYIVISDNEGNVIVDTQSKRRFGKNILDTLSSFAEKDTVDTIRKDLKDGKNATKELMGVTERFLMYYTPVESEKEVALSDSSATDWRIIILTSTAALNKSIAGFSLKARNLLYIMLLLIAVLFVSISIYLARKSRKLLIKESTDHLTGLLSAARFKSDANFLLQQPKRNKYAIVALNVAHFKMFNSQLGHHNADVILYQVGKNIQSFLRIEEIAARTYSDHFAILINLETEQGESRLEALKQHIESAEYSFDSRVELTIGVYRIKDEDKNIVLPLDYARYAQLYLNDEDCQNNNIVYYDDEAFERHKKEIQLTENAINALSKNEFVVYYQLKHGLSNESDWVGCEALVRWGNEKFGFLSPATFIDLFERNGFIIQLDHYVFEVVCSDIRRCLDEGQKVVPVSVNLSKRHFEEENFLEFYKNTIEKYDIPGNLIEFEITETLAVKNTKQVHDAVEQIHKMGCSCALDDFGTGYSSFDMVMSISLDTIKLDASLFRNSTYIDKSRRIIIETLINLSHKLGMSVVAEGIETEAQAISLSEMKCDAIQGYFYAKPLPYEAVRDILNNSVQK